MVDVFDICISGVLKRLIMHGLRGRSLFGNARSLSDESQEFGFQDSEGGIEDKCLNITRNQGFWHFEF